MRSSGGKKLYAVRKSNGEFSDIQTFKRAHGADIKRTAKCEKRQRLLAYIMAFALRTGAGCCETRIYNAAWEKMRGKIDALKLF